MKAEITCVSELTRSMGKHKTIASVLQYNDMVSLMLYAIVSLTLHTFPCTAVFPDQRWNRPSRRQGSNVYLYLECESFGEQHCRGRAAGGGHGSEKIRDESCKIGFAKLEGL